MAWIIGNVHSPKAENVPISARCATPRIFKAHGRATRAYIALADGNGNVTGLMSAESGGLVAEYEYHPFGEELRASGRRIAHEMPLRYQTKFFDKETELTQFGFRHYTATLGRFINRDPVEEPGRWRLFAAMRHGVNNPFAGLKAIGGNWLGDFQSRQDAFTQNTSLPHTTEAIGTGLHKSVSMPRNASVTQKYYSANSSNTEHVGQGGTQGPEWQPMATSVRAADPSNRDRNLYAYAGNDPVNNSDMLGLFVFIYGADDKKIRLPDSLNETTSSMLDKQEKAPDSAPKSQTSQNDQIERSSPQTNVTLPSNPISHITSQFKFNNGYQTLDEAGIAASIAAKKATTQDEKAREYAGELIRYEDNGSIRFGYHEPRAGPGMREVILKGKNVLVNEAPTTYRSSVYGEVVGYYHSHSTSNSFSEGDPLQGGDYVKVNDEQKPLYLGRSSSSILDIFKRPPPIIVEVLEPIIINNGDIKFNVRNLGKY